MEYGEIWQKLSSIDCSKHIEKKGKLSYLSWAWAWGTLMEHYPMATYKIHKERTLPAGTTECRVTVTIEECSRMMWLPVMDFRNDAIENPTTRQLSDTRMRCMVKCLAMFGLAHYIYAGEDLPQTPAFTPAQKQDYIRLMAAGNGFHVKQFAASVGEDILVALFNDAPKGQVVKQKAKYRALVNETNEQIKRTIGSLELAVLDNSTDAINETMAEITDPVEMEFIKGAMDEVLLAQVESAQ